jgi:hypothetical protein
MGSGLGAGAVVVLAGLDPFGPDGGEWPKWVTRVRVRLAVTARRGGADIDAKAIATSAVEALARERGRSASEVLAEWFDLGPSSEDVLTVAGELSDPAPQSVVTAFEGWAKDLGASGRTNLAIGLLDAGLDRSRLFEVLMQIGVDEVELVARIGEEVRGAPRGTRREELMISLAHNRPLDPKAQRAVADLIVELTETGKQVDFKAALKGIPALGREHRSATRLRAAFQTAAEEHRHQLPERVAVQLAEAGVRIPKKAVKKGAWARVKDIFS